MAGLWSIVLPDSTDVYNVITNPSFEIDTTGWEAKGGATISRVTTLSHRGHACLKVEPTMDVYSGVQFPYTFGNSLYYNIGIDFYGDVGASYQLAIETTDSPATTVKASTIITGAGRWERILLSNIPGAGAFAVAVKSNNTDNSAHPFYIDGVCMVATPGATGTDNEIIYIDGDQEDGVWVAQSGLSRSYRKAGSRAGGRVYNIESDLSVYVNSYSGIGMPPSSHLIIQQPLLPGALYRGRKIEPRTISIEADFMGSSLSNLHNLRQTLIDYINPDGFNREEITFRYLGADATVPIYCKAVYDSGLEFGNPTGFDEVAPIRFIAYDPFFYEDGNAAKVIDGYATLAAPYKGNLIKNVHGQWQAVSQGAGTTDVGPIDSINSIGINSYKDIFVGGFFTDLNGTTDGAHISYFSPATNAWVAGAANLDGEVSIITPASDGKTYIGGLFTTRAGDTGFAHIGYTTDHSGTSGSWSHMATGLNGDVRAILEASDANIYIGGTFTSAGGDVDANGFCKWNGTAFSQVGTDRINGSVHALREDNKGNIYIGGLGIYLNGSANKYKIVKYNIDSQTFSTALDGVDATGTIYDIAIGKDNSVYVSGNFTDIGGSGAKYIAHYTGTKWEKLGNSNEIFTALIQEIFIDENGFLYAYTSNELDVIRVWNGYTWSYIDLKITNITATIGDYIFVDGVLYLGFNGNIGNYNISVVNTINNSGSALAYPKLIIKNETASTHHILYLKNETTGKTIYIDYAIRPGETVTYNFAPGEKEATSSVFGNIWNSILKGSDVGEFYLRPGDNRIVYFAERTTAEVLTTALEWKNTYWSADGVSTS